MSPAAQEMDLEKKYQTRRQQAWRSANQIIKKSNKNAKLDALWVSNQHDIQYLTGLHEGSTCLLIGQKWSEMGVYNMFKDVAPQEAPGIDLSVAESESEWLKSALKARKAQKIAFEENHVSIARHRVLTEKLPASIRLLPLSPTVVQLRAVKDLEEINLTKKAVRIAEKAFREIITQGANYLIGRTEHSIATELEYRMRELGADRQGFPGIGMIVASGPNSASCHHEPGKRKVKAAEPLLFDWGAEVSGYRSDITRVIYPKKPPAWIEAIHHKVEEALKKSTTPIKNRVSAQNLYKMSMDIIDSAGYGANYPHSLGHGIGLEIHEYPRLSKKTADRLKSNMIVTVEPGIYLPGKGGVRLENDVLVNADGHTVLNKLPTSLDKSVLP